MEVHMRQRCYLNGELRKTLTGSPDKLRQWIDATESHWRELGDRPLTPLGSFPQNLAHSVNRVSENELVVVNTEGVTLRWVNVEAS